MAITTPSPAPSPEEMSVLYHTLEQLLTAARAGNWARYSLELKLLTGLFPEYRR